MEWIHCNDCYKQMTHCPDVDFVLTPCTRIQCSACNASNSCAKRNCQACRKQNFSTVRLDDSVPPAVGDFFQDPLDHLKKFLKVHEFQSNHRNNLLRHQSEKQQELAAQNSRFQQINSDLKSHNRRLEVENHVIREENGQLKARLQELESRLKKDRNRQNDEPKRHHVTHHSNGSSDSIFASTPIQEPAPPLSRMPAPPAPGPVRRVYQHKAKPSVPFINLQTPSYFPSGRQTPIQVNGQPSRSLVTPQRPNLQSKQSNVKIQYQKVYSFMAAAAQEALTPPAKR